MSVPRVLIITGPSGSGKTTVGREVALRLGWTFVDADDHHAAENIERMRSGLPLTETLRGPWLARLSLLVGEWITRATGAGARSDATQEAAEESGARKPVQVATPAKPAKSVLAGKRGVEDAGAPALIAGTVLACSALRRAHRETLASGREEVWFAFLDVSPGRLRARLAARTGHFMQATLLDSQLRGLEPPGPDEPVWIIPGDGTIDETVGQVLVRLERRFAGPTQGVS